MNVTVEITTLPSNIVCVTTVSPANITLAGNISGADNDTKLCSMEEEDSDSDYGIIVFWGFNHRIVYAFIYIVLAIIGIVGNAMVVLACVMIKKLRTKTNLFVVNLSFADLITSFNLPFAAVGVLSVDHWPLGNGLCIISAATLMMCTGASLYSMAGTAICRCALITLPNSKYQIYLSDVRLGMLLCVSWLIPIVGTFFPVFIVPNFLQYNKRYSTCSWNTDHWFSSIYNLVLFAMMFPIPLSVIGTAYYKIWKHVTNHSKKLARQQTTSQTTSVPGGAAAANNSRQKAAVSKRQMQLTINLLIVVFAFMICICPYCVFLTLPASVGNYWLVPVLAILLQANVCINPVVYGTRHPDFKAAFRNMFRCMRPPDVAPEKTEHSTGDSQC